MSIGRGFIKVDYYIQAILGIFYLVTGVFGAIIPGFWLVTLILQFFIGVWQVLSGLIVGVTNKDKKRLIYLAGVALYFVIIFTGAFLFDQFRFPRQLENVLGTFAMIGVPIAFGVWYFLKTRKDYKSLSDKTFIDPNIKLEMDDILDSDELLKN